MLRSLSASESIQTSRFGGHCPYWTVIDQQVLVGDTAEEIFSAIPEEQRVVDPAAALELLHFNYMLGNRTLIQGVQRMPWRATLKGDGTLERDRPFRHGNRALELRAAASILRERLAEELYEVARQHQRVFLLLTGGLDSRVVAGVLKRIEPQLKVQITCVTWGQPNARDVAYARQIADWYDWEFLQVPYDSELTWNNIQRGAVWGGSEVAGIHLHGMDWFKNAKPQDLVIASSFGDSVGRGEFNSRHLSMIQPHLVQNKEGLVHPSLEADCLAVANRDRTTAWEGASDAPDWAYCELDMQENYMRRMIVHAMDYVRQFCALHQAFTSDEVVSHMWSLPLDCRTDEIYRLLLKDLDPRLHSLPWARTGVAPDGTVERESRLQRKYHQCSRWLHRELRPRLEPLVLCDGLEALGVFYAPAVRRLWEKWSRLPESDPRLCETIVHLASLELSNRRFSLRPCRSVTHTLATSLADWGTHQLGMPRRVFRKYASYALVFRKRYLAPAFRRKRQ